MSIWIVINYCRKQGLHGKGWPHSYGNSTEEGAHTPFLLKEKPELDSNSSNSEALAKVQQVEGTAEDVRGLKQS